FNDVQGFLLYDESGSLLYGAVGIVSADFNKDGFADLATLENYGSNSVPPSISILTNSNGNNFVDTNTIYLAPYSPPTSRISAIPIQSPSYTISTATGIATGDFNNDKYVDFAVTGYTGGYGNGNTALLVIILNDKQNNFYVDTTIAILGPSDNWASAVTAAYFNNDGRTDLAI